MKRRILLLFLLMSLLCGCNGTIEGRDIVEPVRNFSPSTNGNIYPTINVETQATQTARYFVNLLVAGSYGEAYRQLLLEDTPFATVGDFQGWAETLNLVNTGTYEEYSKGSDKYIRYTYDDKVWDILVIPNETGTEWRVKITDFYVYDFEIRVPGTIPVALDGQDITAYKTSTKPDGTAVYKIPIISNAPHQINLSTIFSEDFVIKIPNCNATVTVADHLIVQEPLRTQIRDLAGEVLVVMNDIVQDHDYERFNAYFAPTVTVGDYSAAFDKGFKVKEEIYDLQLAEVRDLEQSDLDVMFTGYNTIKVHFGTRWTWGDPKDLKIDSKTGKVEVKKYSEMRMENTLELYYDGTSWYIAAIDDDSLARLTAGLEQWR